MSQEKRMRLDKLLGHIGLESRKEIKSMVRQGRVTVNGVSVKDSGVQVLPSVDVIEVDGDVVRYREFVYIMLNKPGGVVSATEDHRDDTVIDLLDEEYWPFDLFPVGRLDKDTEGLLLLTNDGALAHRLLSPKHHVPKTYFARIDGHVNEEDVQAFKSGVRLDDGYQTLPAELKILSPGVESEIEVILFEGKFHQVKRMFEAVGKKVIYLKRLRMGDLHLDHELSLGEYRELTDAEVEGLQRASGSASSS